MNGVVDLGIDYEVTEAIRVLTQAKMDYVLELFERLFESDDASWWKAMHDRVTSGMDVNDINAAYYLLSDDAIVEPLGSVQERQECGARFAQVDEVLIGCMHDRSVRLRFLSRNAKRVRSRSFHVFECLERFVTITA